MSLQITIYKHPFSAVEGVQLEHPAGGTIEQFLLDNNPAFKPGSDQPVIARVNGKEVAAVDWDIVTLQAGDHLTLRPRPFGLDPISWVMIAVSAATAIYTYTQMQSLQDLNNDFKDLPEQSPTYDLNAQGNGARLGQPIPAGYGLLRVWPDFASQPFRRYIDGEQYLYHVLSIGQGLYELSDARVGNTDLGNFDGVETELCPPGTAVTLFSSDVYTSDEVSNIELFAPNDPDYTGWSGPYVAVAPDVTATRLELDLLCPQGLYEQDKKTGDLTTVSVTVQAECRQIDNSGNALGVWSALGSWTLTGDSVDAVRKTVGNTVGEGRYEVRVRRTSDSSDPESVRLQDTVYWGQLRAELTSNHTYDHTVWAIKIRVDGQLSALSERKFNVKRQRLLPVWDGNGWTQPTATRNPAWAFCDAIKAHYGGKYDDNHLDLPAIKRLADVWDTRNDYFDYNFDTKGTLDAVLGMICAAGRAVKVEYKGVFSIVRDEPKAVPDYQFGNTEIIPGSFELEYATLDQWENDSVEIEYRDGDTGLPVQILCKLPNKAGTNPLKIRREGISNHAQAYREGMFEAAKMEYRNRVCKFRTELAGGLPEYGSCVAVSHWSSNWGTSGDVVSVVDNGASQTLVLSEPVTFEAGKTHVISLADGMGRPQGPYVVTAGGADNEVVISSAHNAAIYTGFRRKRTAFQFGVGDQHMRRFLMREVLNSGEYEFSLTGEYDDPRVHTIDDDIDAGTLPIPAPPPVVDRELTAVRGFNVSYLGTMSKPILNMSWVAVDSATRYLIMISRDVGVTWSTLAETGALNAKAEVAPGVGLLSIRALNDSYAGPWTEYAFDTTAGDLLPDNPINLRLEDPPFVGRSVAIIWDADISVTRYRVTVIDTASGQVGREADVLNPRFVYTAEQAKADSVGRAITFRVRALTADGYPSATYTQLQVSNPQVGALTSVETVQFSDESWILVDTPADADFAGFRVWASDIDGFTPNNSNIMITQTTDNVVRVPLADGENLFFRVGGFDAWGDDGIAVSDPVLSDGAQILESLLAQNLAQRVDVSDLIAKINTLGQVDTLVETERTERIAADAAEVIARDTAIATAVGDEAAARAAAIQSEQIARADAVGALASDVSTLYTSVGDNTAVLQTQGQSIDGLRAEYTWKVEHYNGALGSYVMAGIGLAADAETGSMILMRADKFGFIATGANEFLQFSMSNGKTVLDGSTYIKEATIGEALIIDGAITRAKIGTAAVGSAQIGDAEIGTLKLAGQAVTVPAAGTGSTYAWTALDAQGGCIIGVGNATVTVTGSGGGDVYIEGSVSVTISVGGVSHTSTQSYGFDSGGSQTLSFSVGAVNEYSVGVQAVSISVSGPTLMTASCSVGAIGGKR